MNPQPEAVSMELAYVGCVVPERLEYHEGNYSHAGNMWQMNALNALANNQLAPSIVLSQRQTRSYRHSGTLVVAPKTDVLSNNMKVYLAPFINFPILRQLSVGLVVVYYLLGWGLAKQRRSKDKVVFSYNLLEPPGIFTWIAGKLIGATTICCINDINVIGETLPDTLINRLAIWLVKNTIGLYDGLIVITDAIAQDFAPGRSYLRVPGAVDTTVLDRLNNTEKPTRPTNTFNIVTTGNLSNINGFEEIIDGFVQTTDASYRLRVAGAGQLQSKVEQAAALDHRIEYLGKLAFDQVLSLYESADCIVNMRLTQRFNTRYFFPSKLFEFLASGVPVITTCPGHVATEYGAIAVLLDQETPAALTAAIDTVAHMTTQERSQLGRAAAHYMRQHYTWDITGGKIVNYMAAVVAGRKAA